MSAASPPYPLKRKRNTRGRIEEWAGKDRADSWDKYCHGVLWLWSKGVQDSVFHYLDNKQEKEKDKDKGKRARPEDDTGSSASMGPPGRKPKKTAATNLDRQIQQSREGFKLRSGNPVIIVVLTSS